MWDLLKTRKASGRISMDRIDTLIGTDVTIFGDLRFSGGIQIDGCINGNVVAESQATSLRLTNHGRICGDVKGPNLVINGKIEGNVYSSERLELHANAVVNGDVHYETIEMVMGAQVNGRLVHISPEESKQIELGISSAQPATAGSSKTSAKATMSDLDTVNPDAVKTSIAGPDLMKISGKRRKPS